AHSSLRLFGAPKDDNRNRRRGNQPPSGGRTDTPGGRSGYDDTTRAPLPFPPTQRNGGGAWVENALIALPAIGSVNGIESRQGDDEFFYSFTSFLYPPSIFRYDLKQKRTETFRAPKLDFNTDAYETKQVFYAS